MTSPASHMLLTPKATLRAEHQTGEDSAERAGERPGEGAGVASTALLQRASAGAGAHYLESYFLVEALELQLTSLRQHLPVTVDVLPGTRKPS